MMGKWKKLKIQGLTVWSYYVYDGYAKELMLRMKEGKDKWLSHALMYPLRFQFWLRYFGYCAVSVPSSTVHVHQRGFHVNEELLRCVDMSCHLDVFSKTHDFRQAKMRVEQRKEIAKYIVLNNVASILGKNVLLFDDIVTTGCSLKKTYDLLQEKGKRITIFSLFYNKRLR